MPVHIPKCNDEHDNYPCWCPVVDTEGKVLRPLVRCKCGTYTGIGLHHVHPDGKVTRSYFHDQGEDACGWHVWLVFDDYDRGEFLPNS